MIVGRTAEKLSIAEKALSELGTQARVSLTEESSVQSFTQTSKTTHSTILQSLQVDECNLMDSLWFSGILAQRPSHENTALGVGTLEGAVKGLANDLGRLESTAYRLHSQTLLLTVEWTLKLKKPTRKDSSPLERIGQAEEITFTLYSTPT
mmetsp:Transcript_6480/g.9623  ORF Transcript_6480/g.9623 Transcript_6480/m.9623 type:complete len:151 (+) Transcript_6480:83-535(+)